MIKLALALMGSMAQLLVRGRIGFWGYRWWQRRPVAHPTGRPHERG